MPVPFIDITEIQFKFQKEKGNTKCRTCKAIEISWKGYRKKNLLKTTTQELSMLMLQQHPDLQIQSGALIILKLPLSVLCQ